MPAPGGNRTWRFALLRKRQDYHNSALAQPGCPCRDFASPLALHCVRQPCRAGLAATAWLLFAAYSRWTGRRWRSDAGLRPCTPVQGEASPCEPLWPAFQLILVYQSQLSIRGQGASMPLAARLESSKRCYWLCQTSGWNEWAGTTPATAPARLNWVRYSHKSQKAKKPKKLSRPQAAKICSGCCCFSGLIGPARR